MSCSSKFCLCKKCDGKCKCKYMWVLLALSAIVLYYFFQKKQMPKLSRNVGPTLSSSSN